MCAGEVVQVEPAAGGGEAIAPRQDSVREDREHQKPAAVARPGNISIFIDKWRSIFKVVWRCAKRQMLEDGVKWRILGEADVQADWNKLMIMI